MAKKPSEKSKSPNGSGHTPEPSAGASYFLSLELENLRCFGERQVLDLSNGKGGPARWTILLGENGTGKTTILQTLAAFEHIRPEDSSVDNMPNSGTPRGLSFIINSRNYISNLGRHKDLKILIFTTYCLLHGLDALDEQSQPGHYNLELGEETPGGFRPILSDSYRMPPVCYGYGASRRLSYATLGRQDFDDATKGLTLYDDMPLRNAEEWLLRLDYAVTKRPRRQTRQGQRLSQVKDLLIEILPDVQEIRFDASSGAYPRPGVEFKTHYGWVPLRQLGHGYRTMIAWIVDFASRMVERYPDSPDHLAEPAVVLIDEIDLHLHPTWQRDLIQFLSKRFPSTQFIATAHSPLIVQSATDANIALLKRAGDHVVIENDVDVIRGWRIDQILTSDLFGIESARPPELDSLLKRRKTLLTKSKLTKKDEKELVELEAKIGVLPTGESFEQAKTMMLIEESLKDLKARIGNKP
jgi:energy-coupling factor transporter ATP-binding protein EcfA2